MKRIEYLYNIPVNKGTEDTPAWVDCLYPKSLPYSAAAEEIAKREAYKGVYEITPDDGLAEEINIIDDIDNMLVDHEMRLTMIELAV